MCTRFIMHLYNNIAISTHAIDCSYLDVLVMRFTFVRVLVPSPHFQSIEKHKISIKTVTNINTVKITIEFDAFKFKFKHNTYTHVVIHIG